MTPEEQKVVESWLNGKGISEDCRACSVGKMHVHPKRMFLAESDTLKNWPPSQVAEVVMTGCPNCGVMVLYGAKVMGLQ